MQAKGTLPPLREDHHGVIPHAGTLYDIETTLIALTEVDPADLTPELRAEYERDLQEAIRKAPEKRERVAIKLFDLGQRAAVKRAAALAHAEKARELQASADRYERDADRLKEYVLTVMRELPKPKKGCRTLEGTSATFKAKGIADSVVIDDEAALPEEFKTVTLKMPAAMWLLIQEEYLEKLENEDPDSHPFACIDVTWGRVPSSDIKAALQKPPEKCAECNGTGLYDRIEHGEIPCSACRGEGEIPPTVPGVHLLTDKLRLEVS